MLESASIRAITKTKIMYMAFVPHGQMNEFLAPLVEYELVRYDQKTHLFSTTSKGMQFLEAYNNLREYLSSVPLM